MKKLSYIIFLTTVLFTLTGCHQSSSEQKTDVRLESDCSYDISPTDNAESILSIDKKTIKVQIDGVDSLLVITLHDNDSTTNKNLFNIAKGGNIECINDTIVNIRNQWIAQFTLADYSQENQIFYILYNCDMDTLLQSGRINLPYFGKSIDGYKSLILDGITADSIHISSSDIDFAIESLSLDCDSDKIINYYEYR